MEKTDKQIIIYYINVTNLSPQAAQNEVSGFMRNYKMNIPGIIQQFIPVIDQPTKVVWLLPMTETEIEMDELNLFQKKIEIINLMKNNNDLKLFYNDLIKKYMKI